MKRSLVAAALGAAILLLAVPALADASTSGHRKGPPMTATPAAAAKAARGAWLRIQPRFVPAARALESSPTATIAGTVLRYDGSPLGNARMLWWIDSDDSPGGSGWTDALGKYQFDGIPVADGDGTVRVDATDGSLSMAWWDLTWAAPGPTGFDFQPGAFEIRAQPGGPWGRRTYGMYVDSISVGESDGGWAATSSPDLYALAPAFPGSLIVGDVYFHGDEGLEIPGLDGATVTAGETVPGLITVEQSKAQRVWTGTGNNALTGPWGSGKPGSAHRLWLQNYPAGWVNQILGWADGGDTEAFKSFGAPTTTGESKYAMRLKIPAEATPGFAYSLELMHLNGGALTLDTWFQVCSLEAGRTTVSEGRGVSLKGVIPIQGNKGSGGGKPSRVYCWVHEGKAGQPTTLATRQLRAQGWKPVGSVRTDDSGAYRMPTVRPERTSTYVVRYPGDAWYYPAYTSPVTVAVR
jgi:hypothetical protein